MGRDGARTLALGIAAAAGILAAGPAQASSIVFTTTGIITLGSAEGAFGLGTPGAPANLAGQPYRITQRFPLANVTSTGTSGPAYDDQFVYLTPGGSADITINNVTVTLTIGPAPSLHNYFGMENGLDAGPRPNLRDIIYGQQTAYLDGAPLVLQFVQQQVLSTTVNLIDSANLLQSLSGSFGLSAASTVTVWDYDYARGFYNFSFDAVPDAMTLATVTAVAEPEAAALFIAGLLALAGIVSSVGPRRAMPA